MLKEIFPAIFGAILLICLCHCTKLNVSTENTVSNAPFASSNSSNSSEQARTFGTVANWFMRDSGVVSGDPNDVRFFLYPNTLDRNYSEEIKFGDVPSLKQSHFYPGAKLKIIIHGFTKNYVSESVQLIKNAYLIRMDQMIRDGGSAFNVILVDWEPLGKPKVDELESLFYRLAVKNVPVVGRRVGEFIQFLIQNGAVRSLRDVHIIGFSLGAHVSGNAGNTLKEFNAGEVPNRVTGLDPAGHAFYQKLPFSSRQLQKTDGRFVDVIHSNMGGLGTLNSLGQVDFFPNGGGPIQQRCEMEYDELQKKRVHGDSSGSSGGVWDSKLLMLNSCSHNKGPHFFALSILNPQMIACKCSDYKHFKSGCDCSETAIFGEYCDPRTRGNFYLDI